MNLLGGAAAPAVLHEGYLTKKGQMLWKRRFFVLFGDGTLRYWDDKDSYQRGRPERNTLKLYGAAVLFVQAPKVPEAIARQGCLEINTPQQTLFAHADNPEQVKQWAQVLHRACQLKTTQVSSQISQSAFDDLRGSSDTKSKEAHELLRRVREEEVRKQMEEDRQRAARELLRSATPSKPS